MDSPNHASRSFWAAVVGTITGAVRAQQEGNNGTVAATDAANQIDTFTTAMNHLFESFEDDAGDAAAIFVHCVVFGVGAGPK
jgi:hypothetical protein